MRRIGIYPGTFDPVHAGHIAFALSALKQCQLDEVAFLPEPSPRYKQHVTDISYRLTLLTIVTATLPNLRIITPTSQQFTVKNTLPELKRLYNDAHFTLLLGSDVIKTFHKWHNLDLLLSEVSLAIGMRAGDALPPIRAVIHHLEAAQTSAIRHAFISTPYAHLASSSIRRKATK